MENINGWLATYRKGKIEIQYKSIEDILTEDLGYSDVVFEEFVLKDGVDDFDEDFSEEMEEASCVSSAYRRLEDDELLDTSNFLTYGKEIEKQGYRMTFKVDESQEDVYDKVMFLIANIKVLE